MTFDKLLNLVSSDKAPGTCIDSRLVKDGDIFVAVKGTVCDGHDFIDQALANGAKYIVCQQDRRQKTENRAPSVSEGQKSRTAEDRKQKTEEKRQKKYEVIAVEDSAKAAALLAQASRGNPTSRLTSLAVTGTNGKTTVAYLVRSCIQKAGEKCGLIGTVIYDTCSGSGCEATLTTPDCLAIAEMTDEMVRNGAKYMVIEASSHALSQNRLAGVNFKAAAFTNLAGDHLDYHKTKEDYLAAKAELFQALSPDAVAVLNKQSPEAELIAKQTQAKVLWYAIDELADITAHVESMDISGTVFAIEYAGQIQKVNTLLPGLYNVSNSLAAAGLCLSAGFDLQTIAAGISALHQVPGRLEKIDGGDFAGAPKRDKGRLGNPSIIVDYAHTDDALKNVLSTLKPLCKGKLRVVFGCGGDRDRTKRPRMARVAEQLADFIIVTNDNPRTEQSADIIDEIVAGFENPDSQTIVVEPDRKKAIELAVEAAGKDDIVLIAGKGHETYQIIGEQKFDFSDKEVAQQCLEGRK
jgi:UDP-N-acetylmuramoyl-L-alanyl-D-glutamate--2,6-diaminopimelate ligase